MQRDKRKDSRRKRIQQSRKLKILRAVLLPQDDQCSVKAGKLECRDEEIGRVLQSMFTIALWYSAYATLQRQLL
jgi:hypothetical protein